MGQISFNDDDDFLDGLMDGPVSVPAVAPSKPRVEESASPTVTHPAPSSSTAGSSGGTESYDLTQPRERGARRFVADLAVPLDTSLCKYVERVMVHWFFQECWKLS